MEDSQYIVPKHEKRIKFNDDYICVKKRSTFLKINIKKYSGKIPKK